MKEETREAVVLLSSFTRPTNRLYATQDTVPSRFPPPSLKHIMSSFTNDQQKTSATSLPDPPCFYAYASPPSSKPGNNDPRCGSGGGLINVPIRYTYSRFQDLCKTEGWEPRIFRYTSPRGPITRNDSAPSCEHDCQGGIGRELPVGYSLNQLEELSGATPEGE